MTNRLGWDEYFMKVANVVATRSTCIRRQVGAVLVSAENRIIATGYNGASSGQPHCIDGACPRGLLTYDELPSKASYSEGIGSCIAIHAEQNAIFQIIAQHPVQGLQLLMESKLYVNYSPCDICKKVIESSKLKNCIYPDDKCSDLLVFMYE